MLPRSGAGLIRVQELLKENLVLDRDLIAFSHVSSPSFSCGIKGSEGIMSRPFEDKFQTMEKKHAPDNRAPSMGETVQKNRVATDWSVETPEMENRFIRK